MTDHARAGRRLARRGARGRVLAPAGSLQLWTGGPGASADARRRRRPAATARDGDATAAMRRQAMRRRPCDALPWPCRGPAVPGHAMHPPASHPLPCVHGHASTAWQDPPGPTRPAPRAARRAPPRHAPAGPRLCGRRPLLLLYCAVEAGPARPARTRTGLARKRGPAAPAGAR